MEGRYTAGNIYSEYESVLSRYGIGKKVLNRNI